MLTEGTTSRLYRQERPRCGLNVGKNISLGNKAWGYGYGNQGRQRRNWTERVLPNVKDPYPQRAFLQYSSGSAGVSGLRFLDQQNVVRCMVNSHSACIQHSGDIYPVIGCPLPRLNAHSLRI